MSATTSEPLPRVQIVNRDHPHFEEYGRFTGKVIHMKFGGGKMAEVRLEHCRPGGDACCVRVGDVDTVRIVIVANWIYNLGKAGNAATNADVVS